MDGIKPKKHMAGMAGSAEGHTGDFGVEPFHAVNGGGPTMGEEPTQKMPHGVNSAMLGDGERGVGKPVGRGSKMMPAQRHPDHGPHMHRPETGSFGVPSLASEQQ